MAMNVSDVNMVAVCQMTSTEDKAAKMETVASLVHRSAALGAKMVFLPECFDYLAWDNKQIVEMAESIEGPIITRCAELAKKHNVWLSLGGFHNKLENDPSHLMVTHLVLDSDGKVVASYDKTHMFDVEFVGKDSFQESSYCKPGATINSLVQTPVGKIGLAICYDMRFPELSICLRQRGAEILTYPSAFTVRTGMAHWEVLLRSRAIENQCYVIASAQTGKHNAIRQSYGRAMVVDPWGSVIARCHEGVDVCIAYIDLAYMKKVRRDMPVWSHRRYDLYGNVTQPKGGSE